jgi:hypothetical protein
MESISQLFLVATEFDGSERCGGEFERDKSKTEESLWASKPIIYTCSLKRQMSESQGDLEGDNIGALFSRRVAWAMRCFRIAQSRAT